jgi:hypothetical protein
VQLFKDGSIAIGFVLFASDPESLGYDFSKSKAIPWMALEDRVFGSIGHGVRVLKGLHVPQVAYARLIIPGVKGYGFVFDPSNWIQYTPADTDTVVSGESMIANFDLPPTEIARPLLEEFCSISGSGTPRATMTTGNSFARGIRPDFESGAITSRNRRSVA